LNCADSTTYWLDIISTDKLNDDIQYEDETINVTSIKDNAFAGQNIGGTLVLPKYLEKIGDD